MELTKTKYKQTEVGLIPEDWEITTLGESVLFLDNLRKPIKSSDREKMKGIYPYYGASGIIDYVNSYIFDDELILLGEDGENILSRNLPLAFIVKGKIWVNNHAHVLKPNDDFDIYYLSEFLESLDYRLLNSGTAQPKLNQKTCRKINVLKPPLSEQKAIAEVLSDVDSLIQVTEQKLAKKRTIKQGAMQKLLTPKEDWEVKKLGEIADINMGQSPKSAFYNKEGIGLPLVQGNADIKNRKTIIRNYTSQITKKCEEGSIIMSVRAPVGEIAITDFMACIGRGVCAINYPNKYLYHYLIYLEPSWSSLSTGSTFDSVNGETIRALEISIPQESEQIRIATILSDMDKEIELIEQQIAKYKTLKQGLMQELLTGRIRLTV